MVIPPVETSAAAAVDAVGTIPAGTPGLERCTSLHASETGLISSETGIVSPETRLVSSESGLVSLETGLVSSETGLDVGLDVGLASVG